MHTQRSLYNSTSTVISILSIHLPPKYIGQNLWGTFYHLIPHSHSGHWWSSSDFSIPTKEWRGKKPIPTPEKKNHWALHSAIPRAINLLKMQSKSWVSLLQWFLTVMSANPSTVGHTLHSWSWFALCVSASALSIKCFGQMGRDYPSGVRHLLTVISPIWLQPLLGDNTLLKYEL